MATIETRSSKGSALTHVELDANFTNLNNDKAEKSNVLTKDNTTAFTPDNDYEPVTKKYVDENSGLNKVLATTEVQTEGQNWNGATYADSDAIGGSPTAKIYPDGTVTGSTDNGSYIKYPNGDLEIKFNTGGLSLSGQAGEGSQTLPIECINTDYFISFLQTAYHTDRRAGRALIWNKLKTTTAWSYRWHSDDSFSWSTTVSFDIMIKGRWK